MKSPTTKLRAAMVAAALVAASEPAAAQSRPIAIRDVADSVIVYRREVFNYLRAGRPDPFRPLVGPQDSGIRLSDLALRGVIYHPDPSRSVAILAQAGVERPVRARVGDRVGGVRIVAIRPRSVEVLVEELGVARRETLEIKKAPAKGTP